MVAEVQTGTVRDYPAYLHFTPRPDQPEKWDEQTSFYEDQSSGVCFLLGGNGCLGKEQELYNLDKLEWIKCSEITEPFRTLGVGPSGVRIQYSTPVYEKGTAELYRVTFRSCPHPIVCTSLHRVLTDEGWKTVGELTQGSRVLRAMASDYPDASHILHDDTSFQETVQAYLPDHQSHAENDAVHLLASEELVEQHQVFCHSFACDTKAHDQCDCGRRGAPAYDQRNFQKVQDCQCCCSSCCGPYDELPLPGLSIDLYEPPLQDGVQEHNLRQHMDDQVSEHGCILDHQLSCLPSILDDQLRMRPSDGERLHSFQEYSTPSFQCIQLSHQPCSESDALCTTQLPCCLGISAANPSSHHSDDSIQAALAADELLQDCSRMPQQYPWSEHCHCTFVEVAQGQSQCVACELLTDDVVEDIEYVRTDVFYDITCFPDSNYLTKGGIISHNSGTTSCLVAKICRFVLETPPPRKDTPFWVISESYQQCGSMFDEKFDQQGHLPPHVIDRERIQWHKVNNNWPFRVPLKSPPGSPGKNWCLEFKSWRQGRGQMQARSLGGFGFIEQFPWGVFEEVLRGCREYNFPGSKLVEYTPVDPDMSVDIEEMIEAGYEPENGKELGRRYLPRNWKIYHANTACAAEAGHVDRGWFEEFFGMVPEDMLDTRMKGLFSTFEGVIYKGFSPEIHCMGDEMWPRIRYCPHRRGIDWGAGPENDFACAWGARNGLGQWFVYDSHSSNDQLKTTVDHLSDVYEQWEWPEDNSLYGTTYADPSSPDNIRIAGKMRTYNPAIGNFSIQRGRNSVLEGIEHIQYLLKPQVPVPVVGLDGKPKLDADGNQVIKLEPKLFFHRQNCAKLIGQMKTYRWLRGADPSTKASRNPRDPARQPLKKNDHLCLAGDVRVLMANNTMIPISQISVGDWVLSHLGITQVVAIECTGVEHVVQFEGPTQVISCTPDHPWYNNFGEYDDMANALWLMRLNPWAQKVITDIPEEHGRHLKPRQNLKAFFVKEISPFDKQEPVYSLATEDGTYFADGLLCSNCDALRYMCFSDDFMSGSTISSATFRSGLNTQLDGHYLPQGDIRHIRTDHRGRN